MNADDVRLLRIAYEEAKAGFDEGGCPIGSVLARGGEVVSQGRNQRVQQGDPIAHGEMDALRKAWREKSAGAAAGHCIRSRAGARTGSSSTTR